MTSIPLETPDDAASTLGHISFFFQLFFKPPKDRLTALHLTGSWKHLSGSSSEPHQESNPFLSSPSPACICFFSG